MTSFDLHFADIPSRPVDPYNSSIRILISDEVGHKIMSWILKLILENLLKFTNVKLMTYKEFGSSDSSLLPENK